MAAGLLGQAQKRAPCQDGGFLTGCLHKVSFELWKVTRSI